MSGISVRTLRLYDELGVARPSGRSRAGYRLYREADLERLQQALFYRELDIGLDEIRRVLDSPGFDPVEALREHRASLGAKAERLEALIATVDKTIRRLTGEEGIMTTEELYEGFDAATAERWEREAEAKWGGGEPYRQSRERIKRMDKAEWQRVGARGAAIEAEFAEAYKSGAKSDGDRAAAASARWAEHLRAFYDPTPEIIAGLGDMYASHPEFRARYEAMAAGLADWLALAMKAHAEAMER